MKVSGSSWVGFATDDFDRSLRFFRDVMGLDIWVEGDRQAILKTTSGQQLEIFGSGNRDQLKAAPAVGFEVDDLDAATEELRAAGVELMSEKGSWNGFAWQYFRSPDGHIFVIKSSPR